MSEVIRARAKVNLRLRVLGRRPDGYHELSTLFDRISLADTVELETAPAISLTCDAPGLPSGPANLAWRAAAAAIAHGRRSASLAPPPRSSSSRSGIEAAGEGNAGVAIRLVKGVPAGAGLGGGSADAAAALVGTNRLLELGLSESVMLSIARNLGADVPFFVFAHLREREDRASGAGRMAWGRGVGERLVSVSSPPALFYVLMNPGFEVSTARVFQAGGFGPLPEGAADVAAEQGKLETIEDVLAILQNDLEPVTSGMHPEVGVLLSALREEGALGVRMSGSGPTVFGVYASRHEADDAAARLQRRFSGTNTKLFVARGE